MADLRAQVIQNAQDLKVAFTGLQSMSSAAMPSRCYEQWSKRATLHQALDATAAIFPARDAAWNAVQAIVNSANSTADPANNVVKHGALDMDFAVARHLSLTSCVTVTWAAYDRLANVCGRLAGVAELAEHPKQNPKVCEDFLGRKDTLGFASHLHIQQAYAWPLKVGANAEVTLEIKADLPDAASEKLVRDVTENWRTLRFESYGFEEA